MRTWILRLAVLGLLAVGQTALASPPSYMPTYLLLRPAGESARRMPHRPVLPAYGIPLQAPGYSYGWFGAAPRRHGDIHRGYYGNYFEWAPRR